MNIFVELGIFVALLCVVCLLEKISSNPEKYLKENDWLSFWEDNSYFLGETTVFVHTLVGLSLWNLVENSWIGWVVAALVFLSFAIFIALLLIGFGGATSEDEEDTEWADHAGYAAVVPVRPGILEQYTAKVSFASLAVIVTIVVQMLFFGPLN